MSVPTRQLKSALAGYIIGWQDPDVQAAAINLIDELDRHLDEQEYETDAGVDDALTALDSAMSEVDDEEANANQEDGGGDETVDDEEDDD